MPKRIDMNEEWDKYKDRIVHHYKTRDKSLREVMELMENEFGLKRTKAQYERILKKWGITKNTRASEWAYIAKRYTERSSQQRPTAVKIGDAILPDARVRKETSRYGYQTTMERVQETLTQRQRSETPPDICVFTPTSESSPEGEAATAIGHHDFADHQIPTFHWTDETFTLLAETTPWRQFMGFVQTLAPTTPTLLFQLPDDSEATEPLHALSGHTEQGTKFEIVVGYKKSHLNIWLDETLYAMYMTALTNSDVPIQRLRPDQFLPPHRQGAPEINVDAVFDLSSRSTQLEFLKHIVFLIANNFNSHEEGLLIAELAKDSHNRVSLRNLLDQQLVVANAIMEKLLFPAVELSNIPLLEMIMEAGSDIDWRQIKFRYTPMDGRTILQIAVEESNEELVSFLLSHGIDDTRTNLIRYKGPGILPMPTKFNSILDLAVENGNFNIVKDILTFRQRQSQCERIAISLHTLRLAVIHGNIAILEYLFETDPATLVQARHHPWFLLEAAALIWDTPTFFDFASKYELDVIKSDELDRGSALAMAAASGNTTLVHRLNQMGAGLSGVPFGNDGNASSFGFYSTRSEPLKFLEGLTGIVSLHYSIRDGNEEMVLLLLSLGADVNQCCQSAFPIQLAVNYRNKPLVRMLLDAGANANAVVGNNDEMANRSVFRDVVGRSAIRLALELGDEPIFDLLLDRGASIPSSSSVAGGWNALGSAAQGRNRKLLKRAFQEFKTANVSAHKGLAECITFCGCDMGQELIDTGSFLPQDIYSPEVLCAAVDQRDKAFVQMLLTKAKASLGRLPPGYGSTGLALAAAYRDIDLIRLFLDAGIKPYEPPIRESLVFGRPALKDFPENALRQLLCSQLPEATDIDPEEHIVLCLDAFDKPTASLEAQELWMYAAYDACDNAIHNYAEFDGKEEIVYDLISKGMDVNWARPGHGTLLQAALGYGASTVAKYLLDQGADPNCPVIPAFFGASHTPLQLASRTGTLDDCKLLIMHGADLYAKPSMCRGATAVQYAAMNGNFQVLNMLLKAGGDVNESPAKFEGRTAIEGAAEHGRLDMVRYLLEAGADVKGKANTNYRRSVYRAWNNNHRALARVIQDWKLENYGTDDCADTEAIVASMTDDELEFASHRAKLEFEEWVQSDDEYMHFWLVLCETKDIRLGRETVESESRRIELRRIKEEQDKLRVKLEKRREAEEEKEWKRYEAWCNSV